MSFWRGVGNSRPTINRPAGAWDHALLPLRLGRQSISAALSVPVPRYHPAMIPPIRKRHPVKLQPLEHALAGAEQLRLAKPREAKTCQTSSRFGTSPRR